MAYVRNSLEGRTLASAARAMSLACVLLAGCALEADQREQEPALQELAPSVAFGARLARAFAELDARRMPVLVAVAHADDPVILREFGALSLDGIRAEETLVDLNSITKTFTGVMAARLVEQGQLRFDDRLGELLPGVPHDKATITLHQLLTHTAGLDEWIGDDDEPISQSHFVRRVLASRLISRPGRAYHYSNIGYGLIAAIIEARTGKSYEATLRDDVLAGLGLDVGYESAYDDVRSLRSARGRTIRDASWGGHAPGWNLIGNGGMVATALDFVRFRQALVGGRVLHPETLARVQAPHVREERDGHTFYGYGVVTSEVEGVGRVYFHDGGNDVFSAHWAHYVDRGDIVFTAAADSRAGDAVEAMAVMARALYDYDADAR